MDKNLAALKPALVWKHFAEIVNIPRPSGSEERIRQYLVDFAVANGIEHQVDEAGNVYMSKPATPGYEERKGIVIQAHVDMVPQKNNDKVFDFINDPIEAYIDGEWVTANGTTLGADNGIGVAAILAVMEDNTIEHGPIEGLFTATEETGMDGAFGLKGGLLKGEILLNLDSETEGELYVGCAGGMDANVTLSYEAQAAPAGKALAITVKGCKGGHSGIQIVCQRANANKLLFRLLRLISKECDMALCSVDGGGLRNAIPREATATIIVPAEAEAKVIAMVEAFEKTVVVEFTDIEDSISVKAEGVDSPAEAMPGCVAERLMAAVVACPDGVAKMSVAMEGLVQTSNNLARVVSDGKQVRLQSLMRSSSRSEKAMLESYEALYGTSPAVMAIHAGLECGIIGTNYPDMDMISFGPTICYPHSPDEKVEIASVEKFYDFLLHTLKNAPKK